MGSLDLPDEPKPTEYASTRGADRPKPREMPDPDERGRVYEAMRECCADAEATKQAERGPESDQPPEAAGQRGYRDEVPRFREMWTEHQKRWPTTRQSAEGQSPDTPEPHHTHGSVPSSPENEALGRVREAERGLSPDAREIEQENKYEGWLGGFEHRLKDEGRLKEKIAERVAGEPDKSPAAILQKIPDAIRFTFCFEPENYTRGYYDTKERLENRGHEMYYSKNWWTDPEYKGINTRWVTAEGQRFEVQFHTPDSFHAKHYITHAAYERIRDQATSRAELRELHAFQSEVSSWVRVPDGAADIPDYKKEGF